MYVKFACGSSLIASQSLALAIDETTVVEHKEYISYLPCGKQKVNALTDLKLNLLYKDMPTWVFIHQYLALVNGLVYPLKAVNDILLIPGVGLNRAYYRHAQVDFLHFPEPITLQPVITSVINPTDPIDTDLTIAAPTAPQSLLFIGGLWIIPDQIVTRGTEWDITLTEEQVDILTRPPVGGLRQPPSTWVELVQQPNSFSVDLPMLETDYQTTYIPNPPLSHASNRPGCLAVGQHGHILPYQPIQGGYVRLRYCHELPTHWATLNVSL